MKFLLKISLIISIIGVSALMYFYLSQPIKNVNTESIKEFKRGVLIEIHGIIINERIINNKFKILNLKDDFNEIEITCSKCPSYLNQEVKIIGKTELYNGRMQISAQEISFLEN